MNTDVDVEIRHVTPADGNVFADLGFDIQEADELKNEADRLIDESRFAKEGYLTQVKEIYESLQALTAQLDEYTEQYKNNSLCFKEYLQYMRSLEPDVTSGFMKGLRVSGPLEYDELHLRFEAFIGAAWIVVLPFSKINPAKQAETLPKKQLDLQVKNAFLVYYEQLSLFESALERNKIFDSGMQTGYWNTYVPSEKLSVQETETPCDCCDRADEYNGFGSDGPLLFVCPKDCQCHD